MGKTIAVFGVREQDSNLVPMEFRGLPRLSPPDMSSISNPGHLWMVCDEWRSPAVDGKQVCIRGPVPMVGGGVAGFFTDGISVPSMAWSVFKLYPFSMPELCGALGHDAVYSGELIDRKTCDQWLMQWELMSGIGKTRSRLIYAAVRAGGGFVWAKHTPESISGVRMFCQLVDDGKPAVWPVIPGAA